MLNSLLMLLFKCNKIDPCRFFLNNLMVPVGLLILLTLAHQYDYVTDVPDVRFESFSVSDPNQTQLSSARLGALAVDVYAVDDLFTGQHERSSEDHGFPVEEIRLRIENSLQNFGLRRSLGGSTDDIQVLLYRLNGTPHVSILTLPTLDTNSIFPFAGLLLSDALSPIQIRDLDLVRDGSMFIMAQVAGTLAGMSNVTNLPDVRIKIDDIQHRRIHSFAEEYHRLIPFVAAVLVALRVVGLLARMEEELYRGSVTAFDAYGIPHTFNTFAWIMTALFEVLLLQVWIMGPLFLSTYVTHVPSETFAGSISLTRLALIIMLYCVNEAISVVWCVALFGRHASIVYGSITSIQLLVNMMHLHKTPFLCLKGATNGFALLSGPYALQVGIRFASAYNLPIPADTIGFMACSGKGHVETLNFWAVSCAMLAWALFFYTVIVIVDSIPVRDGSFRPLLASTIAERIHCREQTPSIDPSDLPLIQTFHKGTKLTMTMVAVTYVNAEKYRVLNNFTLVIPHGQVVSLVGDIQDVGDAVMTILSGVCTKYKGLVTQFGRPADTDYLRNNVSVCPVDFFLLEQLTISTNVKLFLSAREVEGVSVAFQKLFDLGEARIAPYTDAKQVFNALMKDLDMTAPLETTFEILSNSDKRKVCIGVALLGLSDVVVLEEPTRDLSPEDARKLVILLQRETRGRSILLITTDSEFAESVSERVNVCFNGSVVFSGTVTALVSVLLDLPFTLLLHLRLPPRDEADRDRRPGGPDYSNLKLLNLIRTFPSGVQALHISRQSIVLQVRGTDNQVQEVYDTFLSRQSELNIQKITMAEPSLHNALAAVQNEKVTLALLGEQRQIHRNIRDKWNSCKKGLRDLGDRMPFETLLSQIQCMAYMWTLLYMRRGLLPNIIILLSILFMVDCMLFPTGRYLTLVTQMHSFHKKLWGVFCNSDSYARSRNIDQIISVFEDIKAPNVSSEPDMLGQVCLEVTADNTHILHAPVTNIHDLAVFLGRLYNAFLTPEDRINWFYHENSHSHLIRLLSNNLMVVFWSSQFGYMLITTTLVTIDIYCFVCSYDFFEKTRLLQAGLRKCAFWGGIITFAIVKNALILVFFQFRILALHMPIFPAPSYADRLHDFPMKIGTVFLSCGQAAIMSALISTLPLIRWLRRELLAMLLLVNFTTSLLLFFVEILIYEMGHDVPLALLAISVLMPAYHMVFVLRRLHLSIFLSEVCVLPEILEIVCPHYPALARYCCVTTCNNENSDCPAWSIDAYSQLTSDKPGFDRFISIGVLLLLHVTFYSIQYIISVCASRKTNRGDDAGDPEVSAQMRLLRRQCIADHFSVSEKEGVNLIRPQSWDGLLVRNASIYEEGHYVLKDISFSAKPGELVVILGKNGYSRNALLQGIGGIIDFNDGSEVFISRYRVPLSLKHRALIGIANNVETLPGQAVVEDYLNLFNTIREVPGPWQAYHLELAIRVFGLEDVRTLAIESLSYSKRKVVTIASAFIGIPALTILNEPFDLVEPHDRDRICNAINSLKSRDSVILVFSSSLDDALSLELDRAGVLTAGELVTIRSLPDLLAVDIGYHISVRLNAPDSTDAKYSNVMKQQRDFVFKVLSAKFPLAKLVLQAGMLCEFHIRGKNVTCRSINEVKRTIIETLTSAQEIKIGYVSGKRRLLYLIDALANAN